MTDSKLYEIVKNNLHIGISIKNYKEMCKLLEDEEKNGKGRNYQFINWKRFFDWEKKGQKFIVTIIYDIPLPKVDNRKDNNNIYGKYIEKLILDLLVQKYQSKNSSRRLYLSKDNMLQALNIVNINYHYVKFNTGKTADFIKTDNDNLKEFFNLNNKNLTDAVDRALNRLQNKFLVIWNLVYTIAIPEEVTIIDDDGRKIKLKENHITAEQLELEYINTYEKIVSEEMGFENKQEIYLYGKYMEFIKRVCKHLQEQGLDILYYYQSYDVTFHPDVIKERDKLNEYLLEYEERQNVKITINGIVSKQLLKNAEHRQQKAKSKLTPCFGKRNLMSATYEEQKYIRRSKNKYIDDTNKIIDTVINYQTKDLKDSISTYDRLKRKSINKQVNEIVKL